MADTSEPKQLTAASALATPILSGETHAEPCRHLHVYATPQCGARETDSLIVPRPAWRRRNSVSTSLPDAARALSGTNPSNHGREQAMALGSQRQCRGGVRLWQDSHRAGKHAGSQRRQAVFWVGHGPTALGREMGAGNLLNVAECTSVPDRRHA